MRLQLICILSTFILVSGCSTETNLMSVNSQPTIQTEADRISQLSTISLAELTDAQLMELKNYYYSCTNDPNFPLPAIEIEQLVIIYQNEQILRFKR
jgi:uncharacterized protein YcfL